MGYSPAWIASACGTGDAKDCTGPFGLCLLCIRAHRRRAGYIGVEKPEVKRRRWCGTTPRRYYTSETRFRIRNPRRARDHTRASRSFRAGLIGRAPQTYAKRSTPVAWSFSKSVIRTALLRSRFSITRNGKSHCSKRITLAETRAGGSTGRNPHRWLPGYAGAVSPTPT